MEQIFKINNKIATLVCMILLAMMLSISIAAVFASEDCDEDQYAYLEYDFDSKEFSTHYETKSDSSETWRFFTERQVAQMSTKSQVEANSLPSSFVTTPPVAGTPASAVVYVLAYYDTDDDGIIDHTSGGSGFLVSDRVVVTSAHCFLPLENYDTEKIISGATLMSTEIHYNQHSATLNSPRVSAKKQYWSYGYTSEILDVRSRYDYCVIELSESVNREFYFNCIPAEDVELNISVRLTGYPKYYLESTNGKTLEFLDGLRYNLGHTNLSASGMSGGPVYTTYNNCIGVHRGTYGYYSNSGSENSISVLFHSQFYSLICGRITANK